MEIVVPIFIVVVLAIGTLIFVTRQYNLKKSLEKAQVTPTWIQ